MQHTGMGTAHAARLKAPAVSSDEYQTPRAGKNIIVCPQSQGFHDRMGCPTWLDDTLTALRAQTDRPIIVRYKKDQRPLAADLKNAWCVVTHSSNAALQAVIEGVPAICTAPCAAADIKA